MIAQNQVPPTDVTDAELEAASAAFDAKMTEMEGRARTLWVYVSQPEQGRRDAVLALVTEYQPEAENLASLYQRYLSTRPPNPDALSPDQLRAVPRQIADQILAAPPGS